MWIFDEHDICWLFQANSTKTSSVSRDEENNFLQQKISYQA